jgi:hypothetical protein
MKRGDALHEERLMRTYPRWEQSYPESVHTRPLRDDTRRPLQMLAGLLVIALWGATWALCLYIVWRVAQA